MAMTNNDFKQVYLSDVESNKEYFILHDSLQNAGNEILFSVLQKYTCKANCKICYTKPMWSEELESTFVDKEFSDEEESTLLEFFKNFHSVSTIDDLLYIKRKFPNSYKFYQKHSGNIMLCSMTDNAFLQQFDIVMNELKFKNVYDITFSISFLELKDGKICDLIISKLDEMLTHYSIKMIKLIVSDQKDVLTKSYVKMINWCNQHNLFCGVHNDCTTNKNKDDYDLGYAEQLKNYHVKNGVVYPVLNQVLILQRDSFYILLESAIKAEYEPFYKITKESNTNAGIKDFLYSIIAEKLKIYEKFVEDLKDDDSRYVDYFKWVVNHVTVNKNYNLIAYMFLRKHFAITQQLENNGKWFILNGAIYDGQYGMPKSIIDISETPIKRKKEFKIHEI